MGHLRQYLILCLLSCLSIAGSDNKPPALANPTGVRCYMNATLQCIHNMPPLREAIINASKEQNVLEFVESVGNVLQKMKVQSAIDDVVLKTACENVTQRMNIIGSTPNRTWHDASEFFATLITNTLPQNHTYRYLDTEIYPILYQGDTFEDQARKAILDSITEAKTYLRITNWQSIEKLPFELNFTFNNTPTQYNLNSVVISGPGHYWAYVKRGNDTWYKCDDSKIEKEHPQWTSPAFPYMLFYEKVTPQQPEKPIQPSLWESLYNHISALLRSL